MRTRLKRNLQACAAALLISAAGGGAWAEDFAYYLIALAWTPSWCAVEPDADGAEQCDPARDLGFVLHGLWPQYEDGWPEFCDGPGRDPNRDHTAAMADIMGSGGLAWYQWKKHGRCAGLDPAGYFALARRAFREIALPEFDADSVPATAVEHAFLDANPGFAADDVVVTCRAGQVREVRLCVDHALAPRTCGADVLRSACDSGGPLAMPPVR